MNTTIKSITTILIATLAVMLGATLAAPAASAATATGKVTAVGTVDASGYQKFTVKTAGLKAPFTVTVSHGFDSKALFAPVKGVRNGDTLSIPVGQPDTECFAFERGAVNYALNITDKNGKKVRLFIDGSFYAVNDPAAQVTNLK